MLPHEPIIHQEPREALPMWRKTTSYEERKTLEYFKTKTEGFVTKNPIQDIPEWSDEAPWSLRALRKIE